MNAPGPGAATVVSRFNDAWNAHDLDAVMALVAEDCVFEATTPAPDGSRYEGRAAVREAWAPVVGDARAHVTVERTIGDRDHVVQQWCYDWGAGHVRGVDVIRVADGAITAKHSYVKG